MLNSDIKLRSDIFSKDVTQKPLRDGYGEGVVSAGEADDNVVVLCADLSESTRSHHFREKFPERFFELGVAEQNLAAVAAGFGVSGFTPFISSYAMFSPGRAWEQIRTTICYNDANVKVMGHHAGVSVGPDGATHQAIEDVAIMRTLPNMKVFVPVDMLEAKKTVIAVSKFYGPAYVRLAREKTPILTTEDTPFVPGKAYELWQPKNKTKKMDVAIIGAGPILFEALLAARELEKDKLNVSVLNLHTVKPLDENKIISLAKKAGRVVTVEEHQLMGGIGSAIAEVLARHFPVPVEFVGVQDVFGQSGSPAELFHHYGLDKAAIISAVHKVLKRK